MLRLALGFAVFLAQLSAPGNNLPQVMTASFKSAPKAGQKSDITVSFELVRGFAINRTPPISLKLSPVPGIKLDKTEVSSSPNDPKSKDEYYVDLPVLKVPLLASKAGNYEIPAKLTYFFCSKK